MGLGKFLAEQILIIWSSCCQERKRKRQDKLPAPRPLSPPFITPYPSLLRWNNSIALTPILSLLDILWGYLDGATECHFKCILFFLHGFTKSGNEDEIKYLQCAVAPSCFLGVGPSQVRHLFIVFNFLNSGQTVCFLNAISVGVAFEKLKYFEESIPMKKGCIRKLNYGVEEAVKSSLLLVFSDTI